MVQGSPTLWLSMLRRFIKLYNANYCQLTSTFLRWLGIPLTRREKWIASLLKIYNAN